MATKATTPGRVAPGWEPEPAAAADTTGAAVEGTAGVEDPAEEPKKNGKPVAPLTDKEIVGLRKILDRHGFDSKKGKF
jgi:hypothetical protein